MVLECKTLGEKWVHLLLPDKPILDCGTNNQVLNQVVPHVVTNGS